MNLSKINLNLLVALEALLSERHVTRAAQKVHISQSAMSIALSQLRVLLNDDILVRTPQGMMPTQRAQQLQPEIHRILVEIKGLIYAPQTFDAAKASHVFRLGMNDYVEFLVLPRLLEQLTHRAPNISLKIINLNLLDQHEFFEKENLDLAIGILTEKQSPLQTEFLFSDEMVCVGRKNHPLLNKPLTLKKFLEAKHIAINLHSAPTLSRVDKVLKKRGMKRDTALFLPHMISAFYLIRHTDYLLACMHRLAKELVPIFDLSVQKLPFASEPGNVLMAWPKKFNQDPAHTWLRELILQVVKE